MASHTFHLFEANRKHPRATDGDGVDTNLVLTTAEETIILDCGKAPLAGGGQPRSGKTLRLVQMAADVAWRWSDKTGAAGTKALVPQGSALSLRMNQELNTYYIQADTTTGTWWFIVTE